MRKETAPHGQAIQGLNIPSTHGRMPLASCRISKSTIHQYLHDAALPGAPKIQYTF